MLSISPFVLLFWGIASLSRARVRAGAPHMKVQVHECMTWTPVECLDVNVFGEADTEIEIEILLEPQYSASSSIYLLINHRRVALLLAGWFLTHNTNSTPLSTT